MVLPEVLEPYQSKAKRLIAEGCVKEIEFSQGTYQVQVIDGKQEAWAFLQLDERGQVKDSFCSCEEGEEMRPCVHVAAAYLRIFNDENLPLHKRFEKSLWNQLCHLYADRMGYDTSILKHSGRNQYSLSSVGQKQIFYVKAKSAEAGNHLKEVLFHRNKETEETSLKFSNLSPEEILMWKEGRPSSYLLYELSFWNDLAKWLMMMQDNGDKYTIEFEYSTKSIPNYIKIHFPNLEVGFYISEANLPKIIDALGTVKSPLLLHNSDQEAIEKIVFDDTEGCLLIESKVEAPHSKKHNGVKKNGIKIDRWLFVPEDGFFSIDQHGLLATPKLCGKQVSQVLNERMPLLRSYLEGAKIHFYPVQFTYHLEFDSEWNLHIVSYLFRSGDLTREGSFDFGDWVYLYDDGFYHVEYRQFDTLEVVVTPEELANFIQQNRTWLNNQEGFQTHISSIEAQLAYTLSEANQLSFSRKLVVSADVKESKDFGPWIYVPGQGFYSKATTQVGLPLRPDMSLKEDQIPLFIRMNAEELKLVPGFFSQKSPVIKSGVTITLDEDHHIHINPEYELLPAYKKKQVKFFDDYVYVTGEGFHELPVDTRLPERIRHPSIIEGTNIPLFLTYELEGLKHYATHIDPQLVRPEQLRLVATSINEAPETGKGWYSLKLNYQTENGMVSLSSLWTANKQKKRFLFSDYGLIDLEQKRFNWLKMLNKNRIDRRSNTILLSTMELIRLNAFESIEVEKGRGTDYAHSLELLKELTEFRIPEEPDVTGLKSTLRPYQEIGLRWLWFLYHHSLSGLLCDDMGLGKTHQSMALMEAIINYHKDHKEGHHQFLIVCPTSVLYHWQEKLNAFLPELRVSTYYGLDRSLEDFSSSYDVLLTSYGVWRMDHQKLNKIPFELAIFDEIQIAKNQNSRVHASLLNVNATMRLGLTGTPIENHLRELKSLFDIVLPTYMPSDSDYREFFVRPIEKERDMKRRDLLSRFIKPFVLRRKKEDVLTDLPEKTEEVYHAGLTREQVNLYDDVLRRQRERILEELHEDGTPIPYIHVFAILSSLKQICDHPAVFLKKADDYKQHHSGKWELFVELLNEARESQQKVVVFSQYLGMMDIIESHLNEQGIGYATIRGSTTDRGDQVRRFNTDPKCEVFIGSLQAAGLGVDLTAGSVVIHYDRWWNAARENQATDRVHRIGQTRGVQVFKLVTKGTFEEKIDAMITRKGKLMDEVVTRDDHLILKSFDRTELIELLQYVDKVKDQEVVIEAE